jgi:hypothetical protein
MDNSSKLEELRTLATQLSIQIETGKLGDDEFPVRSGFCRIKGQRLILLDKRQSKEEQIEIIVQALAGLNLEDIYLPAWLREKIENPANREIKP